MVCPADQHRQVVARAARAVLDGTGTYEEFLAILTAEDQEDPKLDDLIDQINHLPPRSQLFGFGRRAREEHFAMVRSLIEQVESDASAG